MTIANHPLRAALSEEMHVRRFPRFAAPCRLMQIVTVLGEPTAAAARDHIEKLAFAGRELVPVSAKYAMIDLDGMILVWERHTEFATYTLLRHDAFDAPFDPTWFEPVQTKVMENMPGEIVRATQIAFLPRDAPPPTPDDIRHWFVPEALIHCDVSSGLATVMSDFRLHEDGYGRLLVQDRGLDRDEPAQLILRLQELGNYRNMALLGLPLAQRLTPDVTMLETRLADLTHAVSERMSEDDKLLDELTFLSAELARLLATTRYRMNATRAYGQISKERLDSLGVGAVRGYQTLVDFTERRLMPALRTCDSFSARLEDLSQRAAWTSELLRTRIDIALAKQNRDLLVSMDRRTQLQLRLQQAVEGISAVAISYYLVGLANYLFAAIPGIRHDIAMGITVPLVLIGVSLMTWRLHRTLAD